MFSLDDLTGMRVEYARHSSLKISIEVALPADIVGGGMLAACEKMEYKKKQSKLVTREHGLRSNLGPLHSSLTHPIFTEAELPVTSNKDEIFHRVTSV